MEDVKFAYMSLSNVKCIHLIFYLYCLCVSVFVCQMMIPRYTSHYWPTKKEKQWITLTQATWM